MKAVFFSEKKQQSVQKTAEKQGFSIAGLHS